MSPNPVSPPQIRSEQRGPHWIAWALDSNGKPAGSVVLVGRSQEEAETRARQWTSESPGH